MLVVRDTSQRPEAGATGVVGTRREAITAAAVEH